ncbi:MAG: DNA-3-methyladenine glycosylase 2 family protein [Pseudomonadota bacterium]
MTARAGPRAAAVFDVFGDTAAGCAALRAREPVLARALDVIGAPTVRRREGGYAGLFRIVVEQQVSVASANVTLARCRGGLGAITAGTALAAGEEGLRALGLSGPKACYAVGLARAADAGALDFAALASLSNDDASGALQAHKGVGPWTAAIYLLFCEGRVDLWPPRDVALKAAYNAVRGRSRALDQDAVDARSTRWAPYRGLAAHILWTYFAHERDRKRVAAGKAPIG